MTTSQPVTRPPLDLLAPGTPKTSVVINQPSDLAPYLTTYSTNLASLENTHHIYVFPASAVVVLNCPLTATTGDQISIVAHTLIIRAPVHAIYHILAGSVSVHSLLECTAIFTSWLRVTRSSEVKANTVVASDIHAEGASILGTHAPHFSATRFGCFVGNTLTVGSISTSWVLAGGLHVSTRLYAISVAASREAFLHRATIKSLALAKKRLQFYSEFHARRVASAGGIHFSNQQSLERCRTLVAHKGVIPQGYYAEPNTLDIRAWWAAQLGIDTSSGCHSEFWEQVRAKYPRMPADLKQKTKRYLVATARRNKPEHRRREVARKGVLIAAEHRDIGRHRRLLQQEVECLTKAAHIAICYIQDALVWQLVLGIDEPARGAASQYSATLTPQQRECMQDLVPILSQVVDDVLRTRDAIDDTGTQLGQWLGETAARDVILHKPAPE